MIDPAKILKLSAFEFIEKSLGFDIYENGGKWALTFNNPDVIVRGDALLRLKERAANGLRTVSDLFYNGQVPLPKHILQSGAQALGKNRGTHLHDLQALGNVFEGEISWTSKSLVFPPKSGSLCFWPTSWYGADWNLLPEGTPGAERTGDHALAFELYIPSGKLRENYRISLVRNLKAAENPKVVSIQNAVNAGLFCLWDSDGINTKALCKWGRKDRDDSDHLSQRAISWLHNCDDLLTKNPPYTLQGFVDKWLARSINNLAVRCLISTAED